MESPDDGLSLRRFILPGLFVLALFVVLIARRGPAPDDLNAHSVAGEAMGTTWNVAWVPDGEGGGQDDVRAAASAAIEQVNASMSTYLASSELSRFNDRRDDQPVALGPGLGEVLVEAQRIHGLTGGAFDVTVTPLVRLWGFGARPSTRPPTEAEITEARARIGAEKIELDTQGETLRKKDPRVTIDLSAIAKGYAVDKVAEALLQLGISSFMVELGGEVRAHGDRPGGGAWRIGVETPDGGAQDAQVVVGLRNASMATSGDYRNFADLNGERVSHTIDPRTGRPVAHSLASVSVIHPSCMTADALATALTVLGSDDGLALAEREGWAALFIERAPGGSFHERATTSWNANLEHRPARGAD